MSFLTGILGKIAFIILALVMLAVIISRNGPIM